MSLIRQRNRERRVHCVDTRRKGRRKGGALDGSSLRFFEAAQELERAAGRERQALPDSGAVTAIEQMGPALDAIANANLLLSIMVHELVSEARIRRPDEIAEPSELVGGGDLKRATRLLFGASQNVRIAAEASKLAADAVRSASPSPR